MQAKKKNFCFLGKPPHAWGRHARHHHRTRNRDMDIPTYVGKTPAFTSACTRKGTSPHAWGRRGLEQCSGNIPTYVGKTLIMLSKIKYLTFRKVPNLLTFDGFQKQRERQNHSLKVPKLNAKTFFSSVFKASATNLSSSNNDLITQEKSTSKNSTMKTESYFKHLFLLALWFFFCWHTFLKRAMASTSTIPIME